MVKDLSTNNEPEVVLKESDGRYSVETKTYRDDDLGITFEYPATWGEITVDDEAGNCPSGYEADNCNFRTLLLKEVYSAAIILSAETKGHHDNPPGRGGFWGDDAGNISLNYISECEASQDCTVVENSNDVKFALYKADSRIETNYKPERYYVYNPNNQYYGMVLAADSLNSQATENSSLFKEIVIESFEFIE